MRVPTNRKVKAVILSDSEDEGGSLNTLTCVSFNLDLTVQLFLLFCDLIEIYRISTLLFNEEHKSEFLKG